MSRIIGKEYLSPPQRPSPWVEEVTDGSEPSEVHNQYTRKYERPKYRDVHSPRSNHLPRRDTGLRFVENLGNQTRIITQSPRQSPATQPLATAFSSRRRQGGEYAYRYLKPEAII